jgi:type VI secretion system secreted protein Hcp
MAVDMFLKIDGIDGESVDSKHAKWIEVLSFSWGISDGSRTTNQPGKASKASKVTVSDFSIMKTLDKATPKLFHKCCEGEHVADVSLEVMRSGGEKQLEYLKIKLTDVLISSVSPGGNVGNLPVETVSFSFASSMISVADEKGGFESVGGCGATSFDQLKER